MKVLKKLTLLLVLFTFIVSLNKLNTNIQLPVKSVEARIFLNPNFKYLTLGFKKFFGSMLWINTLLDSDYSHYKQDDLKSWMFLRFNTITDLDPHFLEAYKFGSLYLSVVKDDIKGASYIFTKGLKHFPTDYSLNLYGAYHALYEEKDKALATQRLSIIRSQLTKSPLVLAILYSLRAKNVANVNELNEILEAIAQDPALNEKIRNDLIKKITKYFEEQSKKTRSK